jgi:hypothetical protein
VVWLKSAGPGATLSGGLMKWKKGRFTSPQPQA